MRRIAIDARAMFTSTGRYVERLIAYLQTLDTTNEYVVLLKKNDYGRWTPRAANFRKLVSDYRPFTFQEQIGFAAQLYGLRADLVHFCMPQEPLLYFGRRVTTVHDLTMVDFVARQKRGALAAFYKHNVKPWVFRQAIHRMVHGSAEVITPTQFVRNQLIDRMGANPERVTYTYESADLLADQPQPVPSLAGTRFVLYVGNAFPYKNLERLIDAAAGLDSVTLAIAGKPDYFFSELERYIASRGHANIRYLGFVSDAELAWLYMNAALYVFPSLSEGFGLPGLEAMLYGLPVAASRATCLPEVYGDAAEYFDPTSIEDIRKTVARLLSSPQRLAELKAAGAQRVKIFSWQRMAEQTLSVYQRALSR